MNNYAKALGMAIVLATVALTAPAAHAANMEWVYPANGDWFEPGRWDYDVPLAADYAYINNGGTARIDVGDANVRRLYIGNSVADVGELEINGGTYTSRDVQYVGFSGSGRIIQTGGTHTATGVYSGEVLNLGYHAGSSGVYEMTGGTLWVRTWSYLANEYVGRWGEGTFLQSGGSHVVDGYLYIADNTPGEHGTFDLSGLGELTVKKTAFIGQRGIGQFTQRGASAATFSNDVFVGYHSTADGSMDIQGGTLNIARNLRVGNIGVGSYANSGGSVSIGGDVEVGYQNAGTFDHDGGLTDITGSITFSRTNSGAATSSITGGTLTVGNDFSLGEGAGAAVDHSGGLVDVTDLLYMGNQAAGSGTYNLSGTGELSSYRIYVGRYGAAAFTQSGGVHNTEFLYTAVYTGSSGSYSISDGQLNVGHLFVGGNNGNATFSITDAAAEINVSSEMIVGKNGTFNAVAGSTIHMTGSNFLNTSIDEVAMAGFNDLTIVFEGGVGVVDTFEIGGEDGGLEDSFFDLNFAMDTLIIGGSSEIGHILLMDAYNNGNRGGVGGSAEALYLNRLVILAGSTLDLNGLNLYTKELENHGTITGGDVLTAVPEPGTLALLGVGLVAVVRRVRRKRTESDSGS